MSCGVPGIIGKYCLSFYKQQHDKSENSKENKTKTTIDVYCNQSHAL
jgi:hypothetical protein